MSGSDTLREAAARLRALAAAATSDHTDGLNDAALIVTMHPGVALALADWLDAQGRAMYGTSQGDVPFERHALAVAAVVLGRPGDGEKR